ncbi:hypothetical protein Clocel_3349 [Clostridium cellulovorans 743B]|uniref:Uncharacterized protein n=1 Tax=Clostridium cellulovorans (strain ATCC 35296 / DSM 3052 / OCM 3 / 743B) TaxID=573061 RepID=D9SV55_CLOC7|nr:hypothetical protein Clocel_3349 [Clostridium cellulovorans 743B]
MKRILEDDIIILWLNYTNNSKLVLKFMILYWVWIRINKGGI